MTVPANASSRVVEAEDDLDDEEEQGLNHDKPEKFE
jgi:hypothetical protein